MNNYKLSILQRETQDTGWHGSSQFDLSKITEIKVNNSSNDKSLSAIPSPFARLHLFDAAFSLVAEDLLNDDDDDEHTKVAYKKLVSDCFDVLELLYNWNHHLKEGKPLTIIPWGKNEAIEALKKQFKTAQTRANTRPNRGGPAKKPAAKQDLPGYKQNLVGSTLELFLNQKEFEKFHTFHIIKLGRKVIAGTSPLTGFFTSPNDVSDLLLYNPITRRPYFSSVPRLFKDRDSSVRKYIFDYFKAKDSHGERLFANTLAVREYLRHYRDDVDDKIKLNLVNIIPEVATFDGELKIKTSGEVKDYFEKTLIRLNYKINEKCFYTAAVSGGDDKHSYLLPLTRSFYRDFNIGDIPEIVRITLTAADSVVVTISPPRQASVKKHYEKVQVEPLDGVLIDLWDDLKINFSLSLFPFVYVNNRPDINNYYKIMLACRSIEKRMISQHFNISFFTENLNRIEETGQNISVSRKERTELRDNLFGSTYYEINGGAFKYMQIRIKRPDTPDEIEATVVPRWPARDLNTRKFKYAVDFGTTTTFVAYRDAHSGLLPEPLTIEKPHELLTGHFHEPKTENVTISTQREVDYDVFEAFDEFSDLEIKEFIPVILGNHPTDKFGFPLRTALAEMNDLNGSYFPLSNCNIAFGYGKIAVTDRHQSFITNLKWSLSGENEQRISAFLTELIKIIKYNIIQNGGDPALTDIVWFYPLSFGERNLELFQKTWESLFKSELKSKGNFLKLTESEAPYYFHRETGEFDTLNNILSIDIGGGSTDVVYFEEGSPSIGSSFNFATNLLWSDGTDNAKNLRQNGIYNFLENKIEEYLENKYSNEQNARRKNEIQKIKLINYDYRSNRRYSSEEIINFWISNDEFTGFTYMLERSNFRFNLLFFFSSIIYHAAQLLRINGYQMPEVICFSGNGSRVVDLITTDKKKLSTICSYLINHGFGGNRSSNKLQIILPETQKRKEATCFGGIYEDTNGSGLKPVTFLGYVPEDDESFQKIKHYKEIDTDLEISIDSNLRNFIDTFKHMNEVINFKSELSLEIPITAACNLIKDNIKKNNAYVREKLHKQARPDEQINDSMFFWPLKGILFDLSVADETKLDSYENWISYYFEKPESYTDEFLEVNGRNENNDLSFFRIETRDENDNQGRITILPENPSAVESMLSNPGRSLSYVCDFHHVPKPANSIRMISPGKVTKIDKVWKVKEKIKIEIL